MSLDSLSGSSAVPAFAAPDAESARAFYREALRGAEVWRTGADEGRRAVSFIVSGTLVEVNLDGSVADGAVELYVDDPEELAARCWDAGHRVYVRDDVVRGRLLSAMDPFGRRVDLLDRPTQVTPPPAGEEQP